MLSNKKAGKSIESSIALSNREKSKHFQVIDKTYENNTASDYTEKIEQLGKTFVYSQNENHYWGPPEFSTFYQTPLYEQASPSQKLALNHLYWIGQYQHTASAESNTMLYNKVTSGVFENIKGYETLCQELNFETDQERYHINTFQRIGFKTKISLFGKEFLGNPLHKKIISSSRQTLLNRLAIKSPKWDSFQESFFREITKLFHKNSVKYYSQFLKAQGKGKIPTAMGGLAGLTGSPSLFKFLTLNWGSSPFMAAQYYSARMIANMSLKTYEYPYSKQFRDLEKKNEFIPIPTAVSYYHLLDESFHTTMSQIISQEVYKDFASPTAYEKLLSNAIVFLAQRGILGGLSAGLPATFRDDASFMLSYYRLLISPVFNFSNQDALHWMEKCLCQEHEGLHVNLKHHESLLCDLRRFFGKLDYLWPVNREMKIMAEGGSIKRTIERNRVAFKKLSQLLDEEISPLKRSQEVG